MPAALELTVEAMGAAGDGVARVPGGDGGTCFVPLALPGERVRARIVEPAGTRRRRAARRARSVARRQPGSRRAALPAFSGLRRLRAAALGRRALRRMEAGEARGRARARRLCRCRRGGRPFDPAPRAPPGGPRRATDGCGRDARLPWPRRRGVGGSARLRSAPSAARRAVRSAPGLAARLAGLAARGVGGGEPARHRAGPAAAHGWRPRTRPGAPSWRRSRPSTAFLASRGRRRATRAAEVAAQHGPAAIRFGGVEVHPPPGAFLQASPAGEAAIRDAVLDALPGRLPARAADRGAPRGDRHLELRPGGACATPRRL